MEATNQRSLFDDLESPPGPSVTYDKLLELSIQPLELLLEEVDDKRLVPLLGVGEEALCGGHDADDLSGQGKGSTVSEPE